MSTPPQHDPQKPGSPRRDSFLVNMLARLMILGEKLGPLRGPLLWGLVVLVALLMLGFIPRAIRGRRLASEARAESQSLPSVTVVHAEKSPGMFNLTLPGNVQAIEETQLNARTSGYVKRYLVDIGDRVRAGQALAEIDTPEVDQQAQEASAELARSQATLAQSEAQLSQQSAALQTARANASRANADLAKSQETAAQQRAELRESRANAELARVTWQRWSALVSGGAISQQEADEKHAAYNSSLANVAALEAALRAGNADVQAYAAALKAAQADVTAAGENVKAYRAAVSAAQAGVQASRTNVARFNVLSGFREVRAPYAGVITARNVDEGALVSASGTADTGSTTSAVAAPSSGSSRPGNTGLFTLARTDSLRIYVDVPQNDADSVRPGQIARIAIRELPKQKFSGTIIRTSNSLDQTTRTLRAEITLPNPTGVLIPGMYSQVNLDVPRMQPPVLIPSGALISDAHGNRMAVVQNSRVSFHNVEIGRDFGESLEVTNGIRPGEIVIINPSDDLHDSGKVKASEAPPAKDADSSSSSGVQSSGGQTSGGKQKPASAAQGSNQGGKSEASTSPNAAADKLSSQEGGESEEPRAQPGGAERNAVEKKKAAAIGQKKTPKKQP